MSDTLVLIVAAECKRPCANEPDLHERLRKAMRPVANGHWMTADQDLCFRGAVAAVLMDPETTEDEKQQISDSLTALRGLGAMMSGVSVNLDPEMMAKATVPLMKLWKEVRSE